MKYILALILSLYCLGQPIAYAQHKAEPPQSLPETSTPEKAGIPTVGTDTEPNKKATKSDKNTVSSLDVTAEDVPIDNRAIKVAEEANKWSMWQTIINGIGLILIGAATVFAWGAWMAGKKGVDVTRDIGQKQTMAYLSVKSALIWVPILNNAQKGWRPNNGHFHFTLAPIFENTGNTPARNVEYKFKVWLFGGGEVLLDSDFGESHSFGVVGHKSDTSGALTFLVSTDVPTESIDPINTIDVRTCRVTIRAEYSDVFDNRWYIESKFEGAPHTDSVPAADNVMHLNLDHITAADEHGKIEEA